MKSVLRLLTALFWISRCSQPSIHFQSSVYFEYFAVCVKLHEGQQRQLMNNCLMTGAMIKKFVDTDVCTKEIALQGLAQCKLSGPVAKEDMATGKDDFSKCVLTTCYLNSSPKLYPDVDWRVYERLRRRVVCDVTNSDGTCISVVNLTHTTQNIAAT
ncbi:uncharacterized protein LOC142342319 isoform X1 [Convolutriloba macropyga]|uniref:uncharacterized protein LOC142342319 isoform X1 n=2 Tax=Convolutriloba macropyga TaxID=536237 RepID=UPI003F523662